MTLPEIIYLALVIVFSSCLGAYAGAKHWSKKKFFISLLIFVAAHTAMWIALYPAP